MELKACPVCGSARISFFTAGYDFHYANDGKFSADRCEACDLVFMNPMPSPQELGRFYPSDYYSFESPTLPKGGRVLIRRLLGLHKRTLVPSFAKPGTILDVGCGAGQYLFEMKAKGWRVYGSEFNRSAAIVGRQSGLDVREGELTMAGFEANMFDFVRLNHSFEHMPNSSEVLTEIKRILKPDGRLFIGVPNVAGLWPRLFGRYWWNFGLPVHTYNFSPKSIRALLEANGFRIERLRYYSDYSGLIGSLQIYLNRNLYPRRSTGPLLSNWLLRIPAHYLSRLCDLLRIGDCIEVISSK